MRKNNTLGEYQIKKGLTMVRKILIFFLKDWNCDPIFSANSTWNEENENNGKRGVDCEKD